MADANLKIYCGSSSKAMTDWDKKRRRWKYKNLNISRTKKSFLDETKNNFHISLEGYALMKNKKLLKNIRHKL